MSMEMHTPQSLLAIHRIGDHRRRAGGDRRLGSPAGWVARIRLAIARELKFRRAVVELESLDESALSDLGLRRADIGEAIRWMRANRRRDRASTR